MDKMEFVGRALETNSLTTAGAASSVINPEIWSKVLEDYAKSALVVAPLGVQDDSLLNTGGDVLNKTIRAEVTAAALTESTAITPNAISYTQVTVTPSEYGAAIAVTRKELVRAFFDVMDDKMKDIGYGLAKAKDTAIITALVAGAGNSVVVNGVAPSAIASSDTLDTDDIADARGAIRADDWSAKYIIIHPDCEKSLLKLSDFIDASVYGGREAVLNGEIGKYLGMKVFVTTLIPRNATTSTARDNLVMDDRAFIVAQKMAPTMDSEYKVLEREFVLAGVEDWGVSVLQANKICTLTAYGG